MVADAMAITDGLYLNTCHNQKCSKTYISAVMHLLIIYNAYPKMKSYGENYLHSYKKRPIYKQAL
jgi:hypothetical protein